MAPLTASFAPGGMGGGPEYADVMNQGGLGVYAANGGRLVRQPGGLQASMTMPLPQPGSYVYADGGIVGSPEVFTLWAFVFNYPELCSFPCNGDDLGMDKPAKGGAYNMGGHPASGRTLSVAGRIAVGEPAFRWAALEAPATAEVHLAMAPHGALDPALLPNEFAHPCGQRRVRLLVGVDLRLRHARGRI